MLGMLRRAAARFEEEYGWWATATEMGEQRYGDPDWDGRHTPINRVRFVWEMAPTYARYGVGSLLCRWLGHGGHLKFEGHATPDTGSESWWCDRCGISGHHVYY